MNRLQPQIALALLTAVGCATSSRSREVNPATARADADARAGDKSASIHPGTAFCGSRTATECLDVAVKLAEQGDRLAYDDAVREACAMSDPDGCMLAGLTMATATNVPEGWPVVQNGPVPLRRPARDLEVAAACLERACQLGRPKGCEGARAIRGYLSSLK